MFWKFKDKSLHCSYFSFAKKKYNFTSNVCVNFSKYSIWKQYNLAGIYIFPSGTKKRQQNQEKSYFAIVWYYLYNYLYNVWNFSPSFLYNYAMWTAKDSNKICYMK